MKSIFLIIFMFIISMNAFSALDRKGNGGDGVYLDDQLYLVDFASMGIHKNPLIDKSITPNKTFLSKIKYTLEDLEHFSPELIRLISIKFTEIYNVAPILAFSLLNTLESLMWSTTTESLINAPDADTVINFGNKKLVQLAIRSNNWVTISLAEFDKLTIENSVGLIFHELIFALIKPTIKQSEIYVQYIEDVHKITAFLFSKTFRKQGKKGLARILSRHQLPYVKENEKYVYYTNDQISFSPAIEVCRNHHSTCKIIATGKTNISAALSRIETFCNKHPIENPSSYYSYDTFIDRNKNNRFEIFFKEDNLKLSFEHITNTDGTIIDYRSSEFSTMTLKRSTLYDIDIRIKYGRNSVNTACTEFLTEQTKMYFANFKKFE